MIDSNEISMMTLADFGVDATINGGPETIRIVPHFDGETVLNGEIIEHAGPYAQALVAHVEAVDLYAGNDGDILTVKGSEFVVLAIERDWTDMATLRLGEVA